MRTSIIVLLLLWSKISFCQSYQGYYEGIVDAKLALVSDSLLKSQNHYYEIFERFDFVFARDCYNALEVSTLLEDRKKQDYFLRRCLKQGIEFNLLENDPILVHFKDSGFWPSILSDKDSLRQIYEKTINWEIRKEINLMFAKDQKIRDLADKNRFNIFKIRKLNKEFEETDKQLVLRLIEITKAHGFPGEKLIGLDANDMHPKAESKSLTAGMPIAIFIHHYSQPNESFNALLIDEIGKGNLANEHYAVISDFQYTYGKGTSSPIHCYSQRFSPAEDQKSINANRAQIGLLDLSSTYALQRKKLITPFWMRLR